MGMLKGKNAQCRRWMTRMYIDRVEAVGGDAGVGSKETIRKSRAVGEAHGVVETERWERALRSSASGRFGR